MICDICPHNCDLNINDIGKCLVRKNINDKIELTHYGCFSCIALEFIEKKPLYHFFPGTKFLSVGGYGCSLKCSFCENFEVSQEIKSGVYYSPQALIDLAGGKQAKGIVFTYNEPSIYFEYLMDLYLLAQQAGLKIVLNSNGFINELYLNKLNLIVDAWNIDIKGDDKVYKEICDGELAPVMHTIAFLANESHLEISYLVIPNMIKNFKFHIKMADWIASLSSKIAVHILCCHPVNKMTEFYHNRELIHFEIDYN